MARRKAGGAGKRGRRSKQRRPKSLPIARPGPKIRPSKSGRRRAAVLIAVHLLLAGHVAHWWFTGSTLSPLEPSEAMEVAKHGVVNAGLVFFAAAILLTALFGRFFCGWACHLVALQDLCRWLLGKIGLKPKPLRSWALAWVPMAAFVYMFLWPAAYRLWIGDDFDVERVELTTTRFWATFPGLGVAFLTFFVCGFVIVYVLGAKGFCTYACPYGAIFDVADRLAPMRIRVTDACEGCGHCTAVCSSNVRVHEEVRTWGMVTDPGCMKCMDCVSVCPNDALYLGLGVPALAAGSRPRAAAPSHRRDQTWWEEVLLGIFFVLSFATFRGLYGVVPFLLALGLSAILSFLALQALRLAYKPNLTLRRTAFKRAGRLRPTGFVFLGLAALGGMLWLHSSVVRYQDYRGARLVRAAYAGRAHAGGGGLPILGAEAPELEGRQRVLLEKAALHYQRVHAWGLAVPAPTELTIARLGLALGEEEGLLLHARHALSGATWDAGLRLRLAHHHAARGQPAAAAEMYAQAIEIAPGATEAYLGLGLLHAEAGNLPAALGAFERGLTADPASAELLYNAGLVRAMGGDPERAIGRFEQALAVDPGHLPARENLAGTLCSVGRFRDGLGHYARAVEQSPDDPQTRVLMARAHLALGETTSAQQQLERALELDPSLPRARSMLAEAGRVID